MSVFRRGKRADQEAEVGAAAAEARSSVTGAPDADRTEAGSTEAGPRTDRERGPWDRAEVDGRGRRVDLGALWLPGREGMQLRMEVEKTSKIVTAAAVSLEGSALQLQVFAAPRTAGIWEEIRAEIAESVTKQGGSVDDLPGPFGRELLARLPVRTAEGRTGHRPARFIGHDGPRWFLRGVLTGRAAIEPAEAQPLEEVFADVVVVRGTEPRAPRELLSLTVPGTRRVATPAPAPDPLTRGPEITEIH